MYRVTWIPAILFVLSVPVFLVTASVSWAFNDPGVYHRGFQKYGISRTTGITDADLRQVAGDLRGYFNSRQEPLAVVTRVYGTEQAIFKPREVLHMADVKRLVQWVYVLCLVSGVYLLANTAWGLDSRRRFVPRLARRVLWGGGLTLGLVVAVGLFALTGFDSLFLKFHQVSFANDFWLLDPRTDYLLLLFPQGFWFDVTMRVVVLVVAGAAVLTAACGGYLLRRRWLANGWPVVGGKGSRISPSG
ncbi:MAG: TIGR01906 family membrane protein [Chloroflexi bacterium]|nr:TIGR01906 family membrane protein [Chloroflexota bacterium]